MVFLVLRILIADFQPKIKQKGHRQRFHAGHLTDLISGF